MSNDTAPHDEAQIRIAELSQALEQATDYSRQLGERYKALSDEHSEMREHNTRMAQQVNSLTASLAQAQAALESKVENSDALPGNTIVTDELFRKRLVINGGMAHGEYVSLSDALWAVAQATVAPTATPPAAQGDEFDKACEWLLNEPNHETESPAQSDCGHPAHLFIQSSILGWTRDEDELRVEDSGCLMCYTIELEKEVDELRRRLSPVAAAQRKEQ